MVCQIKEIHGDILVVQRCRYCIIFYRVIVYPWNPIYRRVHGLSTELKYAVRKMRNQIWVGNATMNTWWLIFLMSSLEILLTFFCLIQVDQCVMTSWWKSWLPSLTLVSFSRYKTAITILSSSIKCHYWPEDMDRAMTSWWEQPHWSRIRHPTWSLGWYWSCSYRWHQWQHYQHRLQKQVWTSARYMQRSMRVPLGAKKLSLLNCVFREIPKFLRINKLEYLESQNSWKQVPGKTYQNGHRENKFSQKYPRNDPYQDLWIRWTSNHMKEMLEVICWVLCWPIVPQLESYRKVWSPSSRSHSRGNPETPWSTTNLKDETNGCEMNKHLRVNKDEQTLLISQWSRAVILVAFFSSYYDRKISSG